MARQLRAKDELLAPLMAQTMSKSGAFADLLRDVPEGNRPAKAESLVRAYRGQAQMAVGEFDDAANSLRDAERLDPSKCHCADNDNPPSSQPEADGGRGKKINHVPDHCAARDSSALELKGLILQATGDAAGAATFFDKAIASDRLNIQALLDRANLEASRNQLDQASKDLEIIKKVVPGSPMAAYVDAVVKARQGRFQAADEALDKFAQRHGVSSRARICSPARSSSSSIKFAQAEDYLSKVHRAAAERANSL